MYKLKKETEMPLLDSKYIYSVNKFSILKFSHIYVYVCENRIVLPPVIFEFFNLSWFLDKQVITNVEENRQMKKCVLIRNFFCK